MIIPTTVSITLLKKIMLTSGAFIKLVYFGSSHKIV